MSADAVLLIGPSHVEVSLQANSSKGSKAPSAEARVAPKLARRTGTRWVSSRSVATTRQRIGV